VIDQKAIISTLAVGRQLPLKALAAALSSTCEFELIAAGAGRPDIHVGDLHSMRMVPFLNMMSPHPEMGE